MTTENLKHRMVWLRESRRFSPELLDCFERWVIDAPEEALFRVNPIGFAKQQELSERDAIDLFVHAARAGLFDFAWGRICPACGAFLGSPGLRSLARERMCGMCQVVAGQNLDEGVEVSFTVNPAVRAIRFHGNWAALARTDEGRHRLADDVLRLYFSHAQPFDSDLFDFFRAGIRGISVLPRGPAGTLALELDPAAGDWMVVAPSVHAVARLVADPEGPSTATLLIDEGRIVPEEVRLRPGPVELQVTQRTDEAELVYGAIVLDFSQMGDEDDDDAPALPCAGQLEQPFLTGKRLLSTQSFRELFRTETLPPDGSLEIRALAMLFTDLKASTQLYERVGDLKALALVREHFNLLRDVVDQHEGAVVKTIGDAVMATFHDPVKATAAAVQMHRAMERVRPEELQLKVGLHVGPCVAVDSNERLDYFGQTVNIAARVQALAEGRELVLTDSVLQSPGVAEVLARDNLALSREEAQLKGIDAKVVVHRAAVA